jgi:hypothetical protein
VPIPRIKSADGTSAISLKLLTILQLFDHLVGAGEGRSPQQVIRGQCFAPLEVVGRARRLWSAVDAAILIGIPGAVPAGAAVWDRRARRRLHRGAQTALVHNQQGGPFAAMIDFQEVSQGIVLGKGPCMALRLCDVQLDPIANRALDELRLRYTVAEEKSGLVLTKKSGNLKLFLNDLDDLHQWDFIHNQKMVNENERLRLFLRTVYEQRESWKHRALVAEAKLVDAAAKTSSNSNRQNVSDLRYAALKRYLAKQFHPDYAPGHGIEKIVRNEIFKEIWSEIDRLDDQAMSATCSATTRSSSAM